MLDVNELKADGAAQRAAITEKLDLKGAVALGNKIEQLDAELLRLGLLAQKVQAELDETRGALAAGLQELGLKGLDLASGQRIELQEVVSASITDENAADAHAWLRQHNLGDLIKNVVTVSFGKGEDGYAQLLLKVVRDLQDREELRCGGVEQKEGVHTSTLRAFVKARLAAGEDLPLDLFKVYQGVTAGLVKAKKKRA